MIHAILFSIVGICFIGRKSRRIQGLAFGLLALAASLRYMYGNDYSSYYRWYQRIQSGWESPFDGEILYTALNKFTPSFFVLIAITSCFFILVVYQLIANNLEKEYVWIATLIFLINPYLFLMNLSAIRQCVAMSLYIVAVQCVLKGKKITFFLLIMAAAMFHKTAILLLPTYFLMNTKRMTKKTVVLIMTGIVLIFVFVDVTAVAKGIAGLFNDVNYLSHIENEMNNSLRATVLSGVSLLYVLINLPKLEGKYLVYGKLYLVGITFAVLAYKMSMLTRIQMYFDVFSIVIIPYLLITNKMDGKITIYTRNIVKTIGEIINKYVLPIMIGAVYVLRYYSFFTNPMWKLFTGYRTILDLL